MHSNQRGFSHKKMHLSSWLCHICGMKFKTLENTCKKALKLNSPCSFPSLPSLPKIFEDQGSGYPLRVSKVTLKWTGPVQIFPKGQLGSKLGHTQHS